MKILFISLLEISSISEHGLYSDLLREFAKNGHSLTIISPVERRTGRSGEIINSGNVQIIKVRIGNIQKTNYMEKAISTLMLGSQLTNAIKKNCQNMNFDMLLYATPPVTIYGLVKRIKRLTNASTFLMLKDIWPQEMVDLDIIKNRGPLYSYFVNLEKKMYMISDRIGYTSKANRQYLLEHGIADDKLVAVNNSVDPNFRHEHIFKRHELLEKYGVKNNQIVFFYGGNLGKPQDIDYLVQCLKTQIDCKDRFFIICGQGTEYSKLEKFFQTQKPENMKLFPFLPKEEYDQFIMTADVGMVFLNHRFTVPNCPSRFYTYMEYGKPVFACTDRATDISDDIKNGDFGWWCESVSVAEFKEIVDTICKEGKVELENKGQRARHYLEENYTVDQDYARIIKSVQEMKKERLGRR